MSAISSSRIWIDKTPYGRGSPLQRRIDGRILHQILLKYY